MGSLIFFWFFIGEGGIEEYQLDETCPYSYLNNSCICREMHWKSLIIFNNLSQKAWNPRPKTMKWGTPRAKANPNGRNSSWREYSTSSFCGTILILNSKAVRLLKRTASNIKGNYALRREPWTTLTSPRLMSETASSNLVNWFYNFMLLLISAFYFFSKESPHLL